MKSTLLLSTLALAIAALPASVIAQDAVAFNIAKSDYSTTGVISHTGSVDLPGGNKTSVLTCSIQNPDEWEATKCQTIDLFVTDPALPGTHNQLELNTFCDDLPPPATPAQPKITAQMPYFNVQNPGKVTIQTEAIVDPVRLDSVVATTVSCRMTPQS